MENPKEVPNEAPVEKLAGMPSGKSRLEDLTRDELENRLRILPWTMDGIEAGISTLEREVETEKQKIPMYKAQMEEIKKLLAEME